MADGQAKKGAELRALAEKKMKPMLGGLFGNKYEEAAELLEKAGTSFKLGKCWAEASETYTRLAEVQMKLQSKHESALAYVEAAQCATKYDNPASTSLLRKAVEIFTDMGRLNMAGRQLRQIAEAAEKKGSKVEAIALYEQAADLFETDGSSNSDATKCSLRIAELAAEVEDYKKAVMLFEKAAKRAVENSLLKYSARGYLLQAGICLLCYATKSELQTKLSEYSDIDLQFQGSREAILFQHLVEAFEQGDDGAFATALAEYDTVSRLDPWKTTILVRAKRRIQDAPLLHGDEEEAEYAGAGATNDDDELM